MAKPASRLRARQKIASWITSLHTPESEVVEVLTDSAASEFSNQQSITEAIEDAQRLFHERSDARRIVSDSTLADGLQGLSSTLASTDQLSILLHELSECRADDRESLASMITLLSSGTALYGVLFYVLFGTTAQDTIPDLLWVYVPVIPFGLTGWLLYVGQQVSIRAEYQLRLERRVWKDFPMYALSLGKNGAPDTESSGVPVPAMAHLWVPHVRVNGQGHWSTKVLFSLGGLVLGSMLCVVTAASLLEVASLWFRVPAALVYLTILMFGNYRLYQNFAAPHTMWAISKRYLDKVNALEP